MKPLSYVRILVVIFYLSFLQESICSQVVISQVYGGGGNTGATYKNDFIEIYNKGSVSVSLKGWSVQYAGATSNNFLVTPLPNVELKSGQYFLIQESAGSGGTLELPFPDIIGSIALSGTAGKVALCSSTQELVATDFNSTVPSSAAIIDFVGYGSSATAYEGSTPAVAPNNTKSLQRKFNGSFDMNENSTDFETILASPRNSTVFNTSNITSSPIFSSISGYYTCPFKVSLSTETSNASIYYTLDGSDPTLSKTKMLFKDSIQINSTTTIKAIAYSSEILNASSIVEVTYVYPTEVNSLAQLRTYQQPGLYKLTSEVVLTLKSSINNVMFLQDETAAIQMVDPEMTIQTNYVIGDKLKNIIGHTQISNGMLQLIPITDPGAPVSTNQLVQPKLVSLMQLADNQSMLVKLSAVTINSSGIFSQNQFYNLNGTSNMFLGVLYADLDYVSSTSSIPQCPQDLIGVSTVKNDSVLFVPRSLAEMYNTTGTSEILITGDLAIHWLKDELFFHAMATERVEVFDVFGQKILDVNAVNGLNSIVLNQKGMYIIKVGNRIKKLIK